MTGETFETWRSQIESELAEAQQALAASVEAMHEAEIAHASALALHAAASAAVAGLRGPVSHALAGYIRGIDESRYDTASAMTRLRAEVGHTRERVADLQQASREIALLMAPAPAMEDQDAH
jgi:hypothetical protein